VPFVRGLFAYASMDPLIHSLSSFRMPLNILIISLKAPGVPAEEILSLSLSFLDLFQLDGGQKERKKG
jgi:hypothetical protein